MFFSTLLLEVFTFEILKIINLIKCEKGTTKKKEWNVSMLIFSSLKDRS